MHVVATSSICVLIAAAKTVEVPKWTWASPKKAAPAQYVVASPAPVAVSGAPVTTGGVGVGVNVGR